MTFFNPLNRPDVSSETMGFINDVKNRIVENSRDKPFIFFGDTNHDACVGDILSNNTMFMFSRPMLGALQETGVKHVMVELRLSENVVFDAIAQKKLDPKHVNDVLMPSLYPLSYTPPLVEPVMRRFVAEGVQIAQEMGIKVHCCEGLEGLVSQKNQVQYHYAETERTRLWLDHVLRNPDYFDRPRLLNIPAKGSARAAFSAQVESAPLNEYDAYVHRRRYYERWIEKNGRLKEMEKKTRKMKKDDNEMSKEEMDMFIKQRCQEDKFVMQRMNKLGSGEKAAVFYGMGHIRHEFGGFADILPPGQSTTFYVVSEEDAASVASFPIGKPADFIRDRLRSDDHIIHVAQRRIFEYRDFSPAASHERQVPKPSMG